MGIPAWPLPPCRAASLSRGAQHKVGTQQHKYAAGSQFPPGTAETEGEKLHSPWVPLVGRLQKCSPLQIKAFLLVWMLCLLAESAAKGIRKRSAASLVHPAEAAATNRRRQRLMLARGGRLGLQPHHNTCLKGFKALLVEVSALTLSQVTRDLGSSP